MEVLSARRLAELIGPLADRPRRAAALADRVRLLVGDGRLPVGLRLPAERDLAGALAVSRSTVAAGYADLRGAGWATTRQGAGTWTALPGHAEPAAWVAGPLPAGVLDLEHAAPRARPEVVAALAAGLAALPRLLPTHGYHPAGLPELRALVAERYTNRGAPTTVEQVMITSGGLHAVSLAMDVLARRGQRILIEHPTYPNGLDAARSRGLRPVPVAIPEQDSGHRDQPRTDDGPDGPGRRCGPDGLDHVTALADAARQVRAPLAYLMPDFQNPTGQLLDQEQRGRLAHALTAAGTTVIVDENLVDLGLDAEPPTPFCAFAPTAVSAGSLSKSVWGGLRIGWLRAPAPVIQRLSTTSALRADLSGPVLEQLAGCHLLADFAGVLAARRAELRCQRAALCAALAQHLPEWVVPVPAGGLVLWCRLPAGLQSSALVIEARHRGLRLAAGPRFGTGHAFEDRLRLPYTQPPERLEQAVTVLAAAAEAAADVRVARDPDRTPVV